MSFQPVVPFGGYAGWKFLQKTQPDQVATFQQTAGIRRTVEHFEQTIMNVRSVDDLVGDRRLMSLALGAFGLDADIDHKFFIKKILSEGTSNRESLANRLADKSYFRLSEAFQFDRPSTALLGLPDAISRLPEKFVSQKFAAAVGEIDNDMRLAMNFDRELSELLASQRSKNGRWFAIMGTPPLRAFVEQAFNLPKSIGGIEIDRQKEIFAERAERFFGSSDPATFLEDHNKDRMIQLFFANSSNGGTALKQTGASVALQILRTG